MAQVVTAADRLAFKRCRRAWDLGSRMRQNWEPDETETAVDVGEAVRAALAVWYFPGMWAWDRDIVRPLAMEAHQRVVAGWPAGHDDDAAVGRRLLARYFDWAPATDDFTPIRVETDFQVSIPDPADPVRDLADGHGGAVHFAGRIPLLVVDDMGLHWLVEHRVAGAWAEPDELVLDEAGAASCWAWARFALGMKIAGVLYNELRLDLDLDGAPGGPFRRTIVGRGLIEMERARTKLGIEAREMTGPGLSIYPAPGWDVCSACRYRPPCIALDVGTDADEVLASSYRRRPPPASPAGRLGGVTWSLGRGAAPPQFGHDPRPGP